MLMHGTLAERYRDFARYAHGESPTLEGWALGVAEDPEVQERLAALPLIKQQPNLVFAAARWHGARTPAPYAALRTVLLDRWAEVDATIRSRSTQTNEVGRLATLVPALARIPGPLALVEVGASAGLTLFPDRYDYHWPPLGRLLGSGGPGLEAAASGPMPLPPAHPAVAWRAGCDLNPLDVADEDAMAWLRTLVWPEHEDRRRRLAAAVEATRADPPRILRGDLLELLPSLVAEAGRYGTPVVQHTAVIVYLEAARREEFHRWMTDLVAAGACHWVSNEAPDVLPGVAATGPLPPVDSGSFVLGVDGRSTAWTHGHGRTLHWLENRPTSPTGATP